MASGVQTFGKGIIRVAKNYTKGYSDVQAKVRDATSNDPWGPSGTQMNEIAQLTYNQNDFVEIMEMLDKRLNDKGKNWRHVFKALTLLDYLLHAGSENVIIYFKDNLYVIKTLKEFQFVDEYSKDQGTNVRQKAKDITNLLMDDTRLREERRTRRDMRDRLVTGRSKDGTDGEGEANENVRRRSRSQPPAAKEGAPGRRRTGGEDEELRKAMEESRRSAMAEEDRRKRGNKEQTDLEKALALSRAEAERQRNNQDTSGLFNDEQLSSASPSQLIDLSAQNSLQPQVTSFNPYYAQLQAEQEAQQQAWLQMQAQQQQQDLLAQQQAQQQQQEQERWLQEQYMLQQQQQQQQAQQQEWERMQFMLQQQQQQAQQQQMPTGFPSLAPQPTGFGSNNPFAAFPSTASPPPPVPTMPTSFSQSSIYGSQPSFQSPQPDFAQGMDRQGAQSAPIRVKTTDQNAHLASLFANRDDGVDSFGNTGQLRYGQTQYGRNLAAQPTGMPQGSHNPFGQYGQPQQQQQQQYGQQQGEQPFFSI